MQAMIIYMMNEREILNLVDLHHTFRPMSNPGIRRCKDVPDCNQIKLGISLV